MSIKNKKTKGFATVELLVTIVTIGIILGAFVTTFTTIQNINKKSRDIQRTNIVAFEKTQQYENTDFENIPGSTSPGVPEEIEDFTDELPSSIASPKSAKVYVNSVSPTLKQVIVDVKYGASSTEQTIQYVDFIQRNGVGR